MKMLNRLLLVCLALSLLAGAGSAAADGAEDTPRIILFTCYNNLFPDGLILEAGCIDEDGNLWALERLIPDPGWSFRTYDYISARLKAGDMTSAGTLDPEELLALKSLILCVEDQGSEVEAVCEGGGAESSYAVLRSADGAEQRILLGVSGDSRFENTDPDAQALYLQLRNLFPRVTTFAYSETYGPVGYRPVSLAAFCGWEDIDFSRTVITCAETDCEAGPVPVELSEEDRENVLNLVGTASVTGKASALSVTGNTTVYSFCDGEGNCLASLELYRGLLVWSDGMYTLSGK